MLINVTRTDNQQAPRVLVVAPEHATLPALAPTGEGGEISAMSDELQGVLHIDALIGSVRLTGKGSLADTLRDGGYHILHWIAHGNQDAIMLTHDSVPHARLARLLSEHHVTLVLALTCNSAEYAAALVAAGTPQAIATTGDISNSVARAFSREFYGALARGEGVAEAVAYSRSRLPIEAAGLIVLLPHTEDTWEPSETNLAAELRALRAELDLLRTEFGTQYQALMDKMTLLAQSSDVRAVAQAMLHLAEVLSK